LDRCFVELLLDMLSVELARGMLYVELVKVVDGWLWRNDRIDNIPVVGLGYFGKLVVTRVKDTMKNTTDTEGSIAWYG
jgi:hypothetical protein